MEFSVPGFIKTYCTPNAILTLSEYLMDYAPEKTQVKGWKVIAKELDMLDNFVQKDELKNRIEQIKQGKRDLYF
jgi:2-iminoacetate synthase